jgi:uncharacterized protein (TIGR02246 family)
LPACKSSPSIPPTAFKNDKPGVGFDLNERKKMKNTLMSLKLLLVLAALAFCVSDLPVQVAATTNTLAQDEAAIRENVEQMQAGWNTKSGSLFARPFAEDADYVVINGSYVKGRVTIEKTHQQIFETIYKNTTIRLAVKQVRFLRPDVAVVHVTGHLDAPENEKQLVADASMTMVMTREKQGWQIAAFQNTQVIANQQR